MMEGKPLLKLPPSTWLGSTWIIIVIVIIIFFF